MQCLLKWSWNLKKIAAFGHVNDTMGMNYLIIHGFKKITVVHSRKPVRAIAFIWVIKSSINSIYVLGRMPRNISKESLISLLGNLSWIASTSLPYVLLRHEHLGSWEGGASAAGLRAGGGQQASRCCSSMSLVLSPLSSGVHSKATFSSPWIAGNVHQGPPGKGFHTFINPFSHFLSYIKELKSRFCPCIVVIPKLPH